MDLLPVLPRLRGFVGAALGMLDAASLCSLARASRTWSSAVGRLDASALLAQRFSVPRDGVPPLAALVLLADATRAFPLLVLRGDDGWEEAAGRAATGRATAEAGLEGFRLFNPSASSAVLFSLSSGRPDAALPSPSRGIVRPGAEVAVSVRVRRDGGGGGGVFVLEASAAAVGAQKLLVGEAAGEREALRWTAGGEGPGRLARRGKREMARPARASPSLLWSRLFAPGSPEAARVRRVRVRLDDGRTRAVASLPVSRLRARIEGRHALEQAVRQAASKQEAAAAARRREGSGDADTLAKVLGLGAMQLLLGDRDALAASSACRTLRAADWHWRLRFRRRFGRFPRPFVQEHNGTEDDWRRVLASALRLVEAGRVPVHVALLGEGGDAAREFPFACGRVPARARLDGGGALHVQLFNADDGRAFAYRVRSTVPELCFVREPRGVVAPLDAVRVTVRAGRGAGALLGRPGQEGWHRPALRVELWDAARDPRGDGSPLLSRAVRVEVAPPPRPSSSLSPPSCRVQVAT